MAVQSEYESSAEYLHVLSVPMWEGLRDRLVGVLAGVDAAAGTLLELGAGTGLGTDVLLDTVPDAPLLAVEPSAALRAVLLARLVDRPGGAERVTVHPGTASDAPLPDRLAAVAGLHMIGHLSADERRALFAALAPRMAPGAPVVLNVQPPETAREVPEFPPFGVTVGALRYEGTGSAVPTGPDRVRWTMRYRTLDGERVVGSAMATYDWWTVSAAGLAAELAAAGLTPDVQDDLVVARARGCPSTHAPPAIERGTRAAPCGSVTAPTCT